MTATCDPEVSLGGRALGCVGASACLSWTSLGIQLFLLSADAPTLRERFISNGKESACNEGDLGSIPGLGRSPGGGHGNPLQYSCLENPHGQGSLVGCSHGVTKSGT